MKFHSNTIFHIYNQGNNRQNIFFSDDNYEFFLWKMRAYLLPFGDLLCYSLMPNHFHWLFFVKEVKILREKWSVIGEEIEAKRRQFNKMPFGKKKGKVNKNDKVNKMVSLNESIGVLQRTYTRAINYEQNRSGSLFRAECKAKDGWIDDFITVKNKKGILDNRFSLGNDYAFLCMEYIHNNAVVANLVNRPEEWIYSSARDYAGLREGSICNLKMGRELMRYI